MKKFLEIIKILFAFIIGITILVFTTNCHTNTNTTNNTILDEDTIYILQEEIEDLTEENHELKVEKENLKLDLKNANEYIDELHELMEENGIHETSDIVLTDGPSNDNE